jgi:hypothetical protein
MTATTAKGGQWKDRKQEIDHLMGQNKLAYQTFPIAVQIDKQTNKTSLITFVFFPLPPNV